MSPALLEAPGTLFEAANADAQSRASADAGTRTPAPAPRARPGARARADAHTRTSAPAPRGRRSTLEELLEASWRSVRADGRAECPVCTDTMQLTGDQAHCGGCGTTLA